MIHGRHDAGFEPLAAALRGTLEKSAGGSSVCVYHRGRCVFDMWGGARSAQGEPWLEDTLSVSFSTTKGVASTALHMLVDRGEVAYDDRVAKYWPEFAANGKEAITVRQVMSHAAGLYEIRQILSHADDLLDWDTTVEALAAAPAAHAPGRHHAYHALTYGHLVGEIVRRVSGVPFSKFVADEIAAPLGLTGLHVGATDEAIGRAARLHDAPRRHTVPPGSPRRGTRARARGRRIKMVQRALRLAGMPMDFNRMRDAFAPRGIEHWDFSDPRVLKACIPSANGLFAARDLARMYAALAGGGELDGVRLMGPETIRQAGRVQTKRADGVLVFPMRWRLGYHSVATNVGVPKRAFGHYGYGGSGAWADPSREMSFALTVNARTGTPVGDWRIFKLAGAALSCVRALRRASRAA